MDKIVIRTKENVLQILKELSTEETLIVIHNNRKTEIARTNNGKLAAFTKVGNCTQCEILRPSILSNFIWAYRSEVSIYIPE